MKLSARVSGAIAVAARQVTVVDGFFGRTQEEAALVSDAATLHATKAVADSVVASDAVSMRLDLSLADVSRAVDAPSVDNAAGAGQIDKALQVSVSVTDSGPAFAATTMLFDDVISSEVVTLNLIPGLSPLVVDEQVGASEQVFMNLVRAFADAVQAAESPTLSIAGAQTDYADVTYFAEDYVGISSSSGDYADPTYFAEAYTA